MAKSGVLYLFHLEQRNPSPLGHQARDLLTPTGAGTRAHKKSTFWASRALIYRFEDAGAGSSTYDLIRTCLLNAGRMHVPRDMDGTNVHTHACTNVCHASAYSVEEGPPTPASEKRCRLIRES